MRNAKSAEIKRVKLKKNKKTTCKVLDKDNADVLKYDTGDIKNDTVVSENYIF